MQNLFFLGEIRTREMLDREDIDNFELLVEALDKGSPPKSAQTLVKIQVSDVNDESPQLEVPLNRMLYVAKSGYRSSLIIGAIVASDKDLNDVLTYEVTGKNIYTLFKKLLKMSHLNFGIFHQFLSY